MIYKQQFHVTPTHIEEKMPTAAMRELAIRTNNLAGLIVVQFIDGKPGSYLHELGIDWGFDREDEECPKVYLTLQWAQRAAKKLNNMKYCGEWRVEFWIHEEIEFKRLPKYLKMDGYRFPGNPKQ